MQRMTDSKSNMLLLLLLLAMAIIACLTSTCHAAEGCPDSQLILPCRCSLRGGTEIQIWCSHSNLPQIMEGIKAVERNTRHQRIDELVLENNQLPALPGRFFGSLQIVRLMLRYNGIERLSNGWLNELESSLVEVFIVEPELRGIPAQSLNGMVNLIAITIQSEQLRYLPDFSNLLSLNYLSVLSESLSELPAHTFRHMPKLQHLQIAGGPHLNRLQGNLLDSLISLKHIDLAHNGIDWIHLRTFSRLQNLLSLKLSHNYISDLTMIGRIIKDLENLHKLRLDHNAISVVKDGTFVDLSHLAELHLNDNRIVEIQYGAFLRVSMLKIIYLHNNHIRHIHPESFLQASGSGVEVVYMYNNQIERVEELRSLLDALPTLKFLDISSNLLTAIPYGSLRGHGTLEQLHLNNNQLQHIDHDAFMAMPALRELRLRNNSLDGNGTLPYWNLPGLKGLDLSQNNFQEAHAMLLAGVPFLRRLDLSENGLLLLDPAIFMHNPMLETLNISHNRLTHVHPATMRNLDRLFEVDASNNELKEIIPGLPKIVERISMSGNVIQVLPSHSLGKALNLPNLRMLDLSINQLEHLPKYAFKGVQQLRVLSLANNRLRALDDTSFVGLQRLELLHLQDNELVRIDERTFLPMPELRNLNLQGNKLESITDNLLSNNTRIEQLDLSRNRIRFIAPVAFEQQRALEYLDLSGNALTDISISLSNLINVRDIDLSFNEISHVHADIVAAWHNVVEIRLSNNQITELQKFTFRNLAKLQYLDLSSNEITAVQMAALKNLPDLQELVLADNKLSELQEHVFEELPNLLAAHLQYNKLHYIGAESFYNAPSVVFLNLSNNNFRNMDNIGLSRMPNLEVLDLSANVVKLVPTMPLRSLNWLVELKLDNNEICRIQGTPFETMPRLRVLSMRNNRLRALQEHTFQNLRGNIAIIDVDGNPISCSCDMQWFSVWLHETNFPLPGPKCSDGRLLRSARFEKNICSGSNSGGSGGVLPHYNHKIAAADDRQYGGNSEDRLPLLNEHGDIFQRQLMTQNVIDECDSIASDRPLVGESGYFYDQYVDYTPLNEASDLINETTEPQSPLLVNDRNKSANATLNSNVDLNDTLLNTKYLTKRPNLGAGADGGQSAFTFFGYPLPSLSLGRFFGLGPRGRKDRSEGISNNDGGRSSSITTTGYSGSSNSSESMPATHRMHTTQGKVRMYQPQNDDFEKYLNQALPAQSQYRNRYIDSHSEEMASDEMPPHNDGFKTGFREPTAVQRGGFRPIVPEHNGGFIPMPNRLLTSDDELKPLAPSMVTKDVVHSNSSHKPSDTDSTERIFIPVATKETIVREATAAPQSPSQPVMPPADSSEAGTYAVSEQSVEDDFTTIAPRYQFSTTTPPPSQPLMPPVQSTISASQVAATIRASAKKSTTTTTYLPHTATSLDNSLYDDNDLEAQSVSVLRPPPLVQITTAETILLIPPPEEHVEQFKRHSWVSSSTTSSSTTTAMPTYEDQERSITMAALANTLLATTTTNRVLRPTGGRSTIIKVHSPNADQSDSEPTAEGYHQRADSDTMRYKELQTPDVQERDFQVDETPLPQSPHYAIDKANRKNGMDWYYDSFKNMHHQQSNTKYYEQNAHIPVGGSSLHDDYVHRNNRAMTCNSKHRLFGTLTAMILLRFIT